MHIHIYQKTRTWPPIAFLLAHCQQTYAYIHTNAHAFMMHSNRPPMPDPAEVRGTWHPYWQSLLTWLTGEMSTLDQDSLECKALSSLFVSRGFTFLSSMPADVAKGNDPT